MRIYKRIPRLCIYGELGRRISGDTDIIIDFGNGDKLLLYTYDNVTMLMRYIESDREEKAFITTDVTCLVTLERLISFEWGNSSWD